MADPFEIIMSPYEVYLAPVGTAFPAPEAAITAGWKLLGKNGKLNQSEDGVTVTHDQTLIKHRTGGSTGPVKVARSEETLSIGLTIEDLTMETYSAVLGSAVSDQAPASGLAGVRSIALRQGQDVDLFAILVRGASPYMDSGYAQYQVPRVFQAANPKPKFSKKDAAGLELSFEALEDPWAASETDRFGKLLAMYAPALP